MSCQTSEVSSFLYSLRTPQLNYNTNVSYSWSRLENPLQRVKKNVCMWSKMKQYEMGNTLWFCIISSMTFEGTYEKLVKVIWEDAA